MGYYIRILGRNPDLIPLRELQQAATPAIIEADQDVGDDWESLILKHSSDVPIAHIEKNPVIPGELGGEELNEFIEEVSHYKPASAAEWLSCYLPAVKVIYSFQ